ncbi:transcription factor bHLH30 isoform X2 [Hevea brasiliensis]|uniref:transcription factor bHLH30 isoform X2 n=1 Tax=Hevea brasiliensis TaxID=3981 RepID=UPI0025D31D47|nr:transcription factor bHLH30 isoform X2 [Hevea brasiliensis]
MLPFQGCYGFVHRDPSVVNAMDFKVGASILRSSSRLGKRSTNAFKSHKEAERRRRQRINAHLSTLRSLLPSVTKTDKASLLAKVVHHVKELIRQAAQVARQDGDGFCGSSSSSSSGGGGGSEPEKYCAFPGESDEATLSYCDGEAKTMRVSVCCENRPGLNWELSQAIRLVRGRAVRAEMMTVGGLTKCVVVLQWASGGGGDEEARILRRALKAVVENRVSGCGLGQPS